MKVLKPPTAHRQYSKTLIYPQLLYASLAGVLFRVLLNITILKHVKQGAMLHMRASTFYLLLIAVCASSATSAAQQLRQAWEATHGPITQVPGYEGKLPSKHYGGYISVGNKQLYYYMVESERSPSTDPVV